MNQSAVGLREPANRVSPRARLLWTAEDVIGNVVIGAILVGLAYWLRDKFHVPWWVWAILGSLALLDIVISPSLRYRTHRWEANELAVYTQTGSEMLAMIRPPYGDKFRAQVKSRLKR